MSKHVYVGGRPYEAREDDRGVLRFRKDPDHHLVKQLSSLFGGSGCKDPNDMAIAYHQGEFSLRDYAEMNMGMGYSLGGFEELSAFEDLEILCDEPSMSREGRHFTKEDDIPGAQSSQD